MIFVIDDAAAAVYLRSHRLLPMRCHAEFFADIMLLASMPIF